MNTWLKRGLVALVVVMGVAVVWEEVHGILAGSSGSKPASQPNVDLVVKDISGKAWSLKQHAGRPLLLSFFATWCGPCKLEFPHLLALQKKYAARGVELVMATQEDAKTVGDPGPMVGAGLRVLVDAQPLYDNFGVNPIPHTFVIDGKGKVVADVEAFDPSLAGIRDLEKALEKSMDTASASR